MFFLAEIHTLYINGRNSPASFPSLNYFEIQILTKMTKGTLNVTIGKFLILFFFKKKIE